MDDSIRILIVGDLSSDAELAKREVRRTLTSCVYQRVERRDDCLAALEEFQPDLIISDYQLPHFDGLTALKLARERVPFTPVIILTAKTGAESGQPLSSANPLKAQALCP